jgi:MFS transporter, DHA2 family, multidrug resistance protein
MKGESQPSARDWIAIFGAILGAFMAVLDIQITNAAPARASPAASSSRSH